MTPTAAPTDTTRVPLPVYVLAGTIFALGTTEFMIAGLLPTMAADLDVSISQTGLLISAFALGMTVGAPTMAIATLRLPRKATLLGASAVFVIGHVVAALAPDYSTVMVARVITAVATGAFWAVGAVVTVRITPAAATARALAVLVGGLTMANVIGVPLGTWVGQAWGWRSAFWAVAALAVLGAVAVAAVVRDPGAEDETVGWRSRIGAELAAFRTPRMWLALSTTAVFQAAMFCMFSYVSPLLTDVSGVAENRIPFVLALFGIGSLIGITAGGRIADRGLFRSMVISLVSLTVALLALALVSGNDVATVAAVALVGVTGFSIAPALNTRVFVVAGDAPTLAASVNTSAFNVGNTLGPWIGGTAIAAGWGLVAPVWLAAILTVGALGIAGAALRYERRHLRRQATRATLVSCYTGTST